MITSYNGQAIANSEVQLLVRQEIERQSAEREKAMRERLAEQDRKIRELEERLRTKSARVDALCARQLAALPDTYPEPKRGSRIGDALWGLWGLILLTFDKYNAKAVARWYP